MERPRAAAPGLEPIVAAALLPGQWVCTTPWVVRAGRAVAEYVNASLGRVFDHVVVAVSTSRPPSASIARS